MSLRPMRRGGSSIRCGQQESLSGSTKASHARRHVSDRPVPGLSASFSASIHLNVGGCTRVEHLFEPQTQHPVRGSSRRASKQMAFFARGFPIQRLTNNLYTSIRVELLSHRTSERAPAAVIHR